MGHPRTHAPQRQQGFTLIELLIVIVVLGVLAAVVILALGAFDQRGERAACESDVKTVEAAVEAFRAKEGRYPQTLAELTAQPDNYLRELPNTTPSIGAYWLEYNNSDGKVGGFLEGGTFCAGDLLAMPSPSTSESAGGPGGGGPGGGEPSGGEPSGGEPSGGEPSGGEPSGGEPSGGEPSGSSSSTAPGGGTSSSSSTTAPTGGSSTTPSGGDTSTTPGGGNPLPGVGQPVIASMNCGSVLCDVRIDWPSANGNPSYWYRIALRLKGNCNFLLSVSGLSGDSEETVPLFRGADYCFRVQVIDGVITGPWSPVLVIET